MSDNDIMRSQQPIIEGGGQILWAAIPGWNSSQPPPARLLRFANTEDYSNRRINHIPASYCLLVTSGQWTENNSIQQQYHTLQCIDTQYRTILSNNTTHWYTILQQQYHIPHIGTQYHTILSSNTTQYVLSNNNTTHCGTDDSLLVTD